MAGVSAATEGAHVFDLPTDPADLAGDGPTRHPMPFSRTGRDVYQTLGIPESITCPTCEHTSYHPVDIVEGYCGFCHDFTGAPARDGLQQIGVDNVEKLRRVKQMEIAQQAGMVEKVELGPDDVMMCATAIGLALLAVDTPVLYRPKMRDVIRRLAALVPDDGYYQQVIMMTMPGADQDVQLVRVPIGVDPAWPLPTLDNNELAKCPTCPRCGAPPVTASTRQAFCSGENCRVVMWAPHASAQENMANTRDAGIATGLILAQPAPPFADSTEVNQKPAGADGGVRS